MPPHPSNTSESFAKGNPRLVIKKYFEKIRGVTFNIKSEHKVKEHSDFNI